MNIRPMTPQDRENVLQMGVELSQTAAVEHPAEMSTLARSSNDAVTGHPGLQGANFGNRRRRAARLRLSFLFYSCEVAGDVVMLEEMFIREKFRSQSLGQEFLTWLFTHYPKAARFRLDVTNHNQAVHLYERAGFRQPAYGVMICDCPGFASRPTAS